MSENFSKLVKILEQLRGEQGCPWDREQTRNSIKPYLVEEVYEVVEAIEQSDPLKLKEELGDLMLQILFHSQIAKEQKEFDIEEVLITCSEKLIRRHPHVFGDQKVKDAQEVLQRWEDLKRQERGSHGDASILDGLPKTLPALLQAHRVQERVSRVGFDWPAPSVPSASTKEPLGLAETEGVRGILAKVREELEELESAIKENQEKMIGQELGDLLFSLVNLARFTRIDPEGALRETTYRFIHRFQEMDKMAREQGKSLSSLSLPEMDALWEQAKRNLHN
jgi:tetrapyrrole methylase family protein / MazG family protein